MTKYLKDWVLDATIDKPIFRNLRLPIIRAQHYRIFLDGRGADDLQHHVGAATNFQGIIPFQ